MAATAHGRRASSVLPCGRADAVRQGLIWSGFAVAYAFVRGLTRHDRTTALANARTVLQFEQHLQIASERQLQELVRGVSGVLDVADWTYWLSQFVVVGLALVWIYLRRHDAYVLVRNIVIAVNTAALAAYLVVPTAPPRLVPRAGLVDVLAKSDAPNHGSGIVHLVENPYAAMPSVHAADALVVGAALAALIHPRWLRLLAAAWPVWVSFALVVTGNHFWVDVAAGVVLASAVAAVVTLLGRNSNCGLSRLLTAGAVFSLACATAASVSTAGTTGMWRRLPPAPIGGDEAVAAWTGSQLVVFARAHSHPPWSVDVAASYDPRANRWRTLSPLSGPTGNVQGRYTAVWTGKEVVVVAPFDAQAFDPSTDAWRRLPKRLPPEFGLGLVVWTGREIIAWGGGCCGDASSYGWSYDPATGKLRRLARSPLAPSQGPVGAWTGRELVILVDGVDPYGHRYATALARAAAYDPRTDRWQRIAALPAIRRGAAAVWDGRDLLVVGGAGAVPSTGRPKLARTGFAYDPKADRWRQLAPMPSGRTSFGSVWTGRRLLLWGGGIDETPLAPRPLVYDPARNVWSILPAAPVAGRLDPVAVWTGRSLIVWGGTAPKSPLGTGNRSFVDGAALTPRGGSS